MPGLLALGLGALCLAAVPEGATGQDRLRGLVVTGGFSLEGYRGNLSAVTVPVVDSTDDAAAAVGELGVRGSVLVHEAPSSRVALSFDGGLRQFAATGFELRDYAPREWVGRVALELDRDVGRVGRLGVRVAGRGRWVEDRPPMPLFLQPGYGRASASAHLWVREIEGVRFDVRGDLEWDDYRALRFLPQLDLLDRRSSGVEVGAAWGESWTIRFFGGHRWSEYRNQASFLDPDDPRDDPWRRDRTVQAGMTWSTSQQGRVFARLGVEGTLNRSNSRRPEYDAASVRALVSAPLPGSFGVNLLGVLTAKRYLQESENALLVPGEEADAASLVYLDVNRPVAPNLDAAVRLGWTRAETDIGASYFQRFGISFLLNYRPAM